MKTTAKAHEVRHILADMSIAENHPSTLQESEPRAPVTRRVMHAVHTAIVRSGRLANRNLERKVPAWPVRAEKISVLGYGAEKIVYRVSSPGEEDRVVSVYHRESIGKDSLQVAQRKQGRYDTYKKYFGGLVVPTAFTVVDNPWGSGGKPAGIAPYLANTQRFSNLSEEELVWRAQINPVFSADLKQLQAGYDRMLHDGLAPDFAASNLLVSDANIRIFDTGAIYPAKKLSQLARIHDNYQMMDKLAAQPFIK